MMRAIALTLALLCGGASAQFRTTDKPAFTEADAFKSVAAGMCGTLPVGTGLVNGRGWLHQPIPGPVTIRIVGRGTITRNPVIPPQASITFDMDAGRPYYVIVDAPAGSYLEWKVPGHAWGPVPVGFQLPPTTARQ